MTATAFDTLAYAKRLRDAGVPESQAEAHAEALRQITADQLATKTDIALLQRDLKELELRLEARFADVGRAIEAMKTDLLKWIIGLFIAQVGLFAGLLLGLVKLLH